MDRHRRVFHSVGLTANRHDISTNAPIEAAIAESRLSLRESSVCIGRPAGPLACKVITTNSRRILSKLLLNHQSKNVCRFRDKRFVKIDRG